MPKLLEGNYKSSTSFIVWDVEEDVDFFLSNLSLEKNELVAIEKMPVHRQLEVLAGRYILTLFFEKGKHYRFYKDEYGKPFLADSEFNISISHSRNLVAVAYSPFNIGLDIQVLTQSLVKIKNKFLSEEEKLFCGDDIVKLGQFWTAKEAVYKAYGKKGLRFIEDIKIEDITKNKSNYIGIGSLTDRGISYKIVSYNIDNAILTLAIED